jgi:hypothetical protein
MPSLFLLGVDCNRFVTLEVLSIRVCTTMRRIERQDGTLSSRVNCEQRHLSVPQPALVDKDSSIRLCL